MIFLAHLISWLNAIGNSLFGLLCGPMTVLPAWLSLTIFSAVLGVVAMLFFKYTSNQNAIGRVRDRIKAGMLAMKLFKDHIGVVLKSWVQVISAALMLFVYAIPPLLAMCTPIALIVGQLGVWYQARPLNINEMTTVVMQLSESEGDLLPEVSLDSTEAAEILVGPVRVPSKHQIFWEIRPTKEGIHQLEFDVEGKEVEKELAVGTVRIPVSIKRPGLNISDLIFYPREKPFNSDSIVQSIEIDYQERYSSFLGLGLWFWEMLVISMVFALICKPFLKVRI